MTPQTIWFQQAFMLPVGVGICNKCLMYGYGPYNGRRSWDPKWIDERLHKHGGGCKEGEDGYMADRPSEKTMWPDPGDQKWKSFVYLRAWMNTFKAKADIWFNHTWYKGTMCLAFFFSKM